MLHPKEHPSSLRGSLGIPSAKNKLPSLQSYVLGKRGGGWPRSLNRIWVEVMHSLHVYSHLDNFFANLTPNILSECAWICMGKVYEPHSIAVLCVKQVGKTTEYLLDRVRIATTLFLTCHQGPFHFMVSLI